jgi:hypothetical protein
MLDLILDAAVEGLILVLGATMALVPAIAMGVI